MTPTAQERFLYRASGVGVGGRITDPPHGDIPAQAATSIPPDGGRAEARVEGYNFEGILDVAQAYTVITGNPGVKEGQPINRTVTTATVEGLNVRGVVTANTVVAQLVSEQPAGKHDLKMRPVGHFTNLRIKGILIDPTPHAHLLLSEMKSDIDKFVRQIVVTLPTPIPTRYLCSIFEDQSIAAQVNGKIPGAEAFPGGQIHVDDFGDIYLGEFLVDPDFRRLTMLRIVLASPPSGRVSFCSVEGDGSPPP